MTDETLVIPIEVDSPLNITFHVETGEMTVECFQFVSGAPQANDSLYTAGNTRNAAGTCDFPRETRYNIFNASHAT